MRRVVLLVLLTVVQSAAAGQSAQPVSRADFDKWKKELSNWGRWGSNDELGAANLITPAKRRQAAALVKEGVSVSLARETDTEKAIDNPDPYEHSMLDDRHRSVRRRSSWSRPHAPRLAGAHQVRTGSSTTATSPTLQR